MTIRRFTAKSMSEALSLVRQEMGEDAVILHTRRVPEGSPFGLPSGAIEVTAALPEEDEPVVTPRSPGRSGPQVSRPAGPDELEGLKRELEALRETVRWLARSSGDRASTARSFRDRLFAAGLEAELVQSVCRDVGDDEAPRDQWVQALAAKIPTSGGVGGGGIGPCVVALVGPTGVGKTTTLAKLAAQKKIFENRRVAFLTADTYRIAAIEQLRTFAEIAQIPLEVVYSPGEVPRALQRFRYLDYIFVDTAGRSQRNDEHLADLVALMERLEPNEIHLVLSLTTQQSVLEEVVERFSCVPVTHFLFTKLDENQNQVPIANLSWKYERPVSYITNGQCVPEDILVADSRRIAEGIISQEL